MWRKLAFPACILGAASMIGCLPRTPPADVSIHANHRPAPSKDVADLVHGNNQFAFDLYSILAQQPGNKFFSPYSISSALAMTYAGARGNTAREMVQTLHWTLPDERLHVAFADVIQQLHGNSGKKPYQLRVANALWLERDLTLRPEFQRLTKTQYQAGLELLNFKLNPEAGRATINRWVENKTNNKIRDLLQPGSIRSDTRVVLTNAIYFRSDWLRPFPKATTAAEDWFIEPQKPAGRTPMMHRVDHFSYSETEGLQILHLPYCSEEMSMIVILPRRIDGLAQLEKHLSENTLATELTQARQVLVDVTLPKFKMTEEFQLASTLSQMGMGQVFRDDADFSGMIAKSEKSIKIDEVIHKAYVELDEKGAEAAAATAVVAMPTAIAGPHARAADPPPIPFKADHPFVFVIRQNATGSILFIGRVHDPR